MTSASTYLKSITDAASWAHFLALRQQEQRDPLPDSAGPIPLIARQAAVGVRADRRGGRHDP